jgi:hypothetical protein
MSTLINKIRGAFKRKPKTDVVDDGGGESGEQGSETSTPPKARRARLRHEIDRTTGNAILTCVGCGAKFDKGCPPQDGQDDRWYRCEGCQRAINEGR